MAGYCAGQYGIDGILAIGGFGMNNPAWDIPVLSPLLFEHAVRGENQLLPGASGRRSYPRRLDQADHTLHLTVNGYADFAGTAYTATQTAQGIGMYLNLAALWTNVFAPVTTGAGTRAATLVLADGTTTLTAAVQVTPLRRVGEDFNVYEQDFTFTLTIPAGRFV